MEEFRVRNEVGCGDCFADIKDALDECWCLSQEENTLEYTEHGSGETG